MPELPLHNISHPIRSIDFMPRHPLPKHRETYILPLSNILLAIKVFRNYKMKESDNFSPFQSNQAGKLFSSCASKNKEAATPMAKPQWRGSPHLRTSTLFLIFRSFLLFGKTDCHPARSTVNFNGICRVWVLLLKVFPPFPIKP